MSEPDYEVPKEEWGPGPWENEPDRFEWTTAVGLPGLIVRNHVGALCGYAAVTEGHPFFGVSCNGCLRKHKPTDRRKYLMSLRANRERATSASERKLWENQIRMEVSQPTERWDCTSWRRRGKRCPSPEDVLSAHGGITWSGECNGHICHTPAPGEPERVWWFGFDCAHYCDYTPALAAMIRRLMPRDILDRDEVYRTMDWVKTEVEALAVQLAAFETRTGRRILRRTVTSPSSTVPEDYVTDGPWRVA